MQKLAKQEMTKLQGGAKCDLNAASKNFLQVTCDIAYFATAIWPIGTLIAGPTAVGCLVAKGYCDNF